MITDEMIAGWKAEHRDLMRVDAAAGAMVFRRPSRVEWDRYTDKMAADVSARSEHTRELAQSCLVHPAPAEMRAILDAQPTLLLHEVIDAIGELAGFGATVTTSRL